MLPTFSVRDILRVATVFVVDYLLSRVMPEWYHLVTLMAALVACEFIPTPSITVFAFVDKTTVLTTLGATLLIVYKYVMVFTSLSTSSYMPLLFGIVFGLHAGRGMELLPSVLRQLTPIVQLWYAARRIQAVVRTPPRPVNRTEATPAHGTLSEEDLKELDTLLDS